MEEKTLNQDQDLAVKNNDANKEPEAPKKKKGIKAFLQLIFFIVLSMAGFIVQLLIKTFGVKIGFIKDLDADPSKNFNLFGLSWLNQTLGTFIVVMIGIFLCKLINFILHRKVLFKPRSNLAFGIFMYILFSVALWAATTIVDQPLTKAIYNADFWTQTLFKGNVDSAKSVAGIVAMVTYSCADLIIMFFAEKFLIMNDKLFKKNNKEQVAVAGDVAPVEEQAVVADVAQSETTANDNAVADTAVAPAEESVDTSDTAKNDVEQTEQAETAEQVVEVVEEAVEEEIAEEVAPVEEVKEQQQVEESAAPVFEEIEEEIVEVVEEELPVEVEEVVEEAAQQEEVQEAVADEVVTVEEEIVAEVVEEPIVEEAPVKTAVAKKAPAKKTATKTTAAKKPATTKAAATKTTATKASASKTTATKATAAKKPAAKSTAKKK